MASLEMGKNWVEAHKMALGGPYAITKYGIYCSLESSRDNYAELGSILLGAFERARWASTIYSVVPSPHFGIRILRYKSMYFPN